jgi:hypothetical protein
MKYFVIAVMLLYPLAADAQRPNRARANVQKMLARSSGQTNGAQPSRQPQQSRQPHQSKSHESKPRSARAEALSRSVEEVRMPAGWNTPALKQPGSINDHRDRWRPGQRPGWRPGRFNNRFPGGTYYTTPYTGYGYGWGFYPPWPGGPAESEAPPPPVEETSTTETRGLLRLEITPASGLDYYVDGVFIGNSSTLGSDLELNAGARHLEVRAAGYKPLVFDVRIVVGRETVFRATMEPLVQPQAPQATGNRTMYIIPGCYLGNSPPNASGLRAGCDIKNLVTR